MHHTLYWKTSGEQSYAEAHVARNGSLLPTVMEVRLEVDPPDPVSSLRLIVEATANALIVAPC